MKQCLTLSSIMLKAKLRIPLDEQCKVLNSLFLLYANLRAIEIE